MRVLKPGGHALIACGTRTQHRMVVNIEDAGFEIRDVVSWIYGSGFPKSLNISKAIDKAAGSPQGTTYEPNFKNNDFGKGMGGGKADTTSEPITEAAKQWDGWGTALKPSSEFFTLCRKPLSEKTIAANVLKWGTGGINIDACRVGTEMIEGSRGAGGQNGKYSPIGAGSYSHQGRFPANLIHDGSQEVLELFPETKTGSVKPYKNKGCNIQMNASKEITSTHTGDQGSAARYFYCAKASKKDREEGCEDLEGHNTYSESAATPMRDHRKQAKRSNNHPTVKPTALMAYLCRLITPKGGVVLDPYMGSGSTGKAAVQEGFSFVGIELDDQYYDICKARIENAFYR
jgi:DNA modification methylase